MEVIKKGIVRIIEAIGENPNREGLLDTPRRYAEAFQFLTSGYKVDPDQLVRKALFDAESSQLVLVKNIEFYSLCEHHLLPFFGRVHVGYLPSKKIVGISKIPRVVDAFARRLQVQERMTNQIAQLLMESVQPHGVAVVAEANHLCMMMRGVEKQSSDTVTSCMLGEFQSNAMSRAEVLGLLKR